MKSKFWKINNKADSKTADLLLYGVISSTTWQGDEVTPKQFKADLDALGEVEVINVYINSDGGDVFAGQAIHSMLKRHKAKINVYVDGLAASIASVIAMAGDKIYMPVNSMLMVHNPWTYAMGNAKDFRKIADDLDNIRESIISAYLEKTILSKEKLIELLDAETWLTAEEAIKFGFADEIEKEKTVAASINNGLLILNGQQLDLSKYQRPPKLAFIAPMTNNQDENSTQDEVIDNNQADQALDTQTKIPPSIFEEQTDPQIEYSVKSEQENNLFFFYSKQIEANKNVLEVTKYE